MGGLFALFSSNELNNFELKWETMMKKCHKDDAKLYSQTLKILKRCEEIEDALSSYKGAKPEIKEAMSAKQDSEEYITLTKKALEIVIPNASLCQEWRQFSIYLGEFLSTKLLPQFRDQLIITNENDDHLEIDDDDADNQMEEEEEEKKEPITSNNANNNSDNNNAKNDNKVSELKMVQHQALLKQCAHILDFLLRFDQAKMMEPQIQNDFSFYKRNLSKKEFFEDEKPPVELQDAGFLSMFLAQATPLIKQISTELSKDQDSVNMLGVFSNACCDLLKGNKLNGNKQFAKLTLRAMTTSFVIYDHANKDGGFHRNSITKAQKIVSMITSDYVEIYGVKDDVKGLDNIIKFTTLHFNDTGTPQAVKRLLN